MAEKRSDQEKTEKATPKKREEARKKGQVAKSQELASVGVLSACLVVFYFGSYDMLEKMLDIMRNSFVESAQFNIDCNNIQYFLIGFANKIFNLLIPFLLVALFMALFINYLQVGFVFSADPIQPKLSKIDPINGFRRLFSIRSFVELTKNIFKILIIALLIYITIKEEIENIILLPDQSVGGILVYIGKLAFKIVFRTCLLLIMLAIFDYLYQRWEFEKNLKMSRQEVKDELKQTEGDPIIRARIKRLQREAARKRMMASVPKADVVITNPAHLAVAIHYDQSRMSAPKVVAKGMGYLAERIRKIATENNVPIVENKPLAQILYKMVNVAEVIPANLYKAVAEVLAFVYSMR
ncbi:MAG: flagellar biosynthesis protein FlhB [Deltaproteobacteria bacterium]|uniref:Flagellar biosynthetic protein FlhB n=1 Tax=Desulfofervidus auxilii TaxID=1621989 RepID=A0A7C0Y377_DESA2|nr:flagellar biosynthesis protein FlhB [Deltaproteobacteria bacterium]HDD44546.1 flagellar biosynthesis protein FlhB [Candidatus Desulfofervidus auxilii]